MWAQLIKARLQPAKEEELRRIEDEIRDASPPGSGFIRATTMRDQNDPSQRYTLVLFESEEKARQREKDPRVQEAAGKMSQVFQGPPEFVNLEVVRDQ